MHLSGPGQPVPVGIGEIVIERAPASLYTVLGSCIGIVAYDVRAAVGGIAHIMLPSGVLKPSSPAKYADTGVPELLRRMKEKGAGREMKVKIAGGANMFSKLGSSGAMKIGEQNAAAVKELLKQLGVTISAQDLGGAVGRKVTLRMETWQVSVAMISGEERLL